MQAQKPLRGMVWIVPSQSTISIKKDAEQVSPLTPHSLSLPGFKTFLIPRSSLFRRAIWFFIFVTLVCTCGFQISARVRFYLEYPVSTVFATKYRTTFRFPNISFCLFNPHATTKFQKYLPLGNYTVTDVYALLKRPGFTVEELWELSYEDMDKFVLECTFGTKRCNTKEYWSLENLVAGRCHILSINEDIPYQGTNTGIQLKLKDFQTYTAIDSYKYISWKFLLHNSQFNKMYGSYIQGTSLYHGTLSRYKFFEEEVIYENTPMRPCVSSSDYTDCRQRCYEEQFYKNQPKCRLPFTVVASFDHPCTFEEFSTIYNYSLINMFARIDSSLCNCGRPCIDVNYNVKPDILNNNAGIPPDVCTIVITPGRANVESMYEIRAYTLTSLVSDIGGALGLYLGACILTFFEIINLVFQAITGKFRSSVKKA